MNDKPSRWGLRDILWAKVGSRT